MQSPFAYMGKKVVVLGMAKSGVSSARFMHKVGAVVTLNDRTEREKVEAQAEELEAAGITVILGGHPDDLITPDVALVIKNPGIPYTIGPIRQAQALGIEIVTEVELAYLITDAPIIGITGSNGKTTTTSLAGYILEHAGRKAHVAGNIGTPLIEAAQRALPGEWIVAELSSFQLKGTHAFRPRIAVLLNVVPTHLDYHGGMQDYIASKLRLFINMRAGDTAVLNADDPVCNYVAAVLRGHELSLKHENALGTDVRSAFAELRRVFATVPRDERPRVVLFSVTKELESGVFARPPYPAELGAPDPVRTGRELIWQLDGSQDYVRIVPTADMGLPGQHNVANSAAAVSALLGAGLSASEFAEPLKTFRGVEHRLEFVVEHDGIRYYNNSKATNAVAATISLYSFPAGKIVLICGGIDRGEDFKSLVPHLTKQAKAMVTMGETREVLAWRGRAAGLTGVVIVEPKESAADTLYQAVREATNLASPGDVVLLSPACASWDQFTSYEERGRIFKEAAHKL